MKEFKIGINDSGQRLDKFLSKAVKGLPASLMYKYIRKKRIKLNGKRCEASSKLCEGDILELYINDEFFVSDANYSFKAAPPVINVAYEDKNILVTDKKSGLVVHEDEHGGADTLINRIKHYLYEKGEYDPDSELSFSPALCNRIDRNTEGLVICAKNAEALRVLNQKIKDREIKKLYLCAAVGHFKSKEGELVSFLLKDEKKNEVRVFEASRAGAKRAVTRYKVLAECGELSLLEVELLTGRTHQIRAQLAHFSHPLLGDGKYGDGESNRRYGVKTQALCAHKLRFEFKTEAGSLKYLNGLEIVSREPWFTKKYFEEVG